MVKSTSRILQGKPGVVALLVEQVVMPRLFGRPVVEATADSQNLRYYRQGQRLQILTCIIHDVTLSTGLYSIIFIAIKIVFLLHVFVSPFYADFQI